MLATHKVSALFLITTGAHSEREFNVVKCLFSDILTFSGASLAVQKSS